jgi:CHAT domain-containing protein
LVAGGAPAIQTWVVSLVAKDNRHKMPIGTEIEAAFTAAEAERKAGNYQRALDDYLSIVKKRLATLRESPSDSKLAAADMVVIERAADLAVLFGHDQGADNLLCGMVTALQDAGNSFAADYVGLKRIHLAMSFGRLSDARNLLSLLKPRIGNVQSISLDAVGIRSWESTCHWSESGAAERAVLFSRLYLVLGGLLSALGQYQASLLTLRRGLDFTGQDHPDLARRAAVPLELSIAAALLEQGELDAAESQLRLVESKVDRKLAPGFHVWLLELRGKTKLLRGEFGAALKDYLAIHAYCMSGAFARAGLQATANLCHALILLNNTRVALDLLTQARDAALKIDETAIAARITFLISLAQERAKSHANDLSAAPSVVTMRQPLPKEAFTISPATREPELPPDPNFLTLFEDRCLQVHWQLSNGDFTRAGQRIRSLRRSFGKSDSGLIHVKLKVMKATTAYYCGHVRRAERLLRKSLPVLRGLGLLPDLWQAQKILGWCWIRLRSSDSQRAELTRENQQLLDAMTRSLPAGYQSIFLLNKWTQDEEFIAGKIRWLELQRSQLSHSSWWKRPLFRWRFWQGIYDLLLHIDRYKAALARDTTDDDTVPPNTKTKPSFWKFFLGHTRDRATIIFLVLPDRVLILCAGWLTLDFEVSYVTRLRIRELVRGWHRATIRDGRFRGGAEEFSDGDLLGVDYLDGLVTGTRNLTPIRDQDVTNGRQAKEFEELANLLQLPELIKNLPDRVEALTIVPDDSLLGFPFAAMKFQNKYLIERYRLNIDFSCSTDHASAADPVEPNALFVGVAKGPGPHSQLPGVLPEIRELEEWSSNRKLKYQTLLDEAATRTAITHHVSRASLFHIACHGVFKPNQPDASGLVLLSKDNHSEILSLRELSTLNLESVRHVSLSSCWSADNFILPGRWIIGLPETLRRAGAGSILASLWDLDDRFARAFTNRFYEYLNKYPRDQALQQTQLDCLESQNAKQQLNGVEGLDTSNPIYWAAYNLYGDYRPLNL